MIFRSVLLPCLCIAAGARAQGDIAGLLSTQPGLSILLDLITLTGLNETLSTASNITIIAPTNAAFEELLEMNIPESEAIVNRDEAAITALLNNHVWRGYYPSEVVTDVPTFVQSFVTPDESNEQQPFTDISGGQYNGIIRNGSAVALIDGQVIPSNAVVLISGELSLSNVITANIRVGDGIIIHTVDSVLMFGPPLELYTIRAGLTGFNGALTALAQEGVDLLLGIDGNNTESGASDITVFIPINEAFESIGSVLETANASTLEDVVTYHLLTDNIVFSPSFGNYSATTLQGTDLTFTVLDDGSIFVNNARVIFPNVILSNGVAHIIDSVLNPANASVDRAALDSDAPPAVQFADASAAPLPFTTFTFAELSTETYSTPRLLTTAVPIAVTTSSPGEVEATATDQPTAATFTGAAGLAQPCMTALAAVAGGILLAAA